MNEGDSQLIAEVRKSGSRSEFAFAGHEWSLLELSAPSNTWRGDKHYSLRSIDGGRIVGEVLGRWRNVSEGDAMSIACSVGRNYVRLLHIHFTQTILLHWNYVDANGVLCGHVEVMENFPGVTMKNRRHWCLALKDAEDRCVAELHGGGELEFCDVRISYPSGLKTTFRTSIEGNGLMEMFNMSGRNAWVIAHKEGLLMDAVEVVGLTSLAWRMAFHTKDF